MRIIRTHEDIEAGLAGLVMLDARLEHVVARAGPVPLRRTDPGYRGLASIIVSQMVSKASAAAIWKRMEASLGEITAPAALTLSDEDCRAIGLSRAKADALRRVAQVVVAGEIDLDAICNVEAPEAIRELTTIKGVGRWTAEVYLLVLCRASGCLSIRRCRACRTRSATGSVSNCARPPARLIRWPRPGRLGAASRHVCSGPITPKKCGGMLFL